MGDPTNVVDGQAVTDSADELDRASYAAKLAYVLHSLVDAVPARSEAVLVHLHQIVTDVCGHAVTAAADAVHDPETFAAALENGAYIPPAPAPGPVDPKDAEIAALREQLAAAEAAQAAPAEPAAPAQPPAPAEPVTAS